MRAVSWNMGAQTVGERTHHAAWRHLLDVLKPDGALVQEARPLPDIAVELGSSVCFQPVSNVSWCSGVLVRAGTLAPCRMELSTEWSDYVRISAADVGGVDDGVFRAVSVHPHYGRFDEALLAQRADLDARLECANSVWSCDVAYVLARDLVSDQQRFVVAGDWNTARLFDHTSTAFDPGSGAAFFERATVDGWSDLYCRRHGREGRTWFRGRDHGYQLDHMFADPLTAARLIDVWIDERAAVDPRLSDHAPLIADFA
jgi:hypothetical protein